MRYSMLEGKQPLVTDYCWYGLVGGIYLASDASRRFSTWKSCWQASHAVVRSSGKIVLMRNLNEAVTGRWSDARTSSRR